MPNTFAILSQNQTHLVWRSSVTNYCYVSVIDCYCVCLVSENGTANGHNIHYICRS